MTPLPPDRLLLEPVWQWPVKFCAATTVTVYVLSLITGNVSQVDRVWTFMPTIYTAYFALLPLWPQIAPSFLFPYAPAELSPAMTTDYSPRAVMMLGLQVIWMSRLSYNTWRRGLFNLHDEDYRWLVLRQKLPAWFFQVVNLTFIAIIQNIILFLLGVPAAVASMQPHVPLTTSDYALGSLSLVTILLEFVSDNQQYSFQTYKYSGPPGQRVREKNEWPGARIEWTEQDAERGFVTRGLWAWSRHPNFLCEQTFWILQTLIPLLSPQSPSLPKLHFDPHHPSTLWHSLTHSSTPLWPLTPALVLCALFFSSTLFTESITFQKYPVAYKAYQSRVAMFVPFLTPVWGALLQLQGKKKSIDALLFGSGKGKEKEQ